MDEPGFPLYPFGFGLSYTSFEITDYRVSAREMTSDGNVVVSCKVTNTGHAAGTEVVQLYFTDQVASVIRPNKELAGFARVELQPGESKEVYFRFYADETALLDRQFCWIVETGDVELLVGNSSENLMSVGMVNVTTSKQLENGRRHYFAERI